MQGKRKHGGRVRLGTALEPIPGCGTDLTDDDADDVRRIMGPIYCPHVGVNEQRFGLLVSCLVW